jgi:5'-phosphate synthase pdxT subunit
LVKTNIDIHLALQGAFIEHKMALERLPYQSNLEIILVKTVDDLNRCSALIIPGGGG